MVIGLILNKGILTTTNFNKIIIFFAISLILSSFLIIADIKFALGIKLWLSKNLDFENFKNLYQLKTWVSFNDFRGDFEDTIITYIQNTYDRGVVSLVVLSFPITVISYIYHLKLLASFVLLMSMTLVIFNFILL